MTLRPPVLGSGRAAPAPSAWASPTTPYATSPPLANLAMRTAQPLDESPPARARRLGLLKPTERGAEPATADPQSGCRRQPRLTQAAPGYCRQPPATAGSPRPLGRGGARFRQGPRRT